jgi:hypothetical protein
MSVINCLYENEITTNKKRATPCHSISNLFFELKGTNSRHQHIFTLKRHKARLAPTVIAPHIYAAKEVHRKSAPRLPQAWSCSKDNEFKTCFQKERKKGTYPLVKNPDSGGKTQRNKKSKPKTHERDRGWSTTVVEGKGRKPETEEGKKPAPPRPPLLSSRSDHLPARSPRQEASPPCCDAMGPQADEAGEGAEDGGRAASPGTGLEGTVTFSRFRLDLLQAVRLADLGRFGD